VKFGRDVGWRAGALIHRQDGARPPQPVGKQTLGQRERSRVDDVAGRQQQRFYTAGWDRRLMCTTGGAAAACAREHTSPVYDSEDDQAEINPEPLAERERPISDRDRHLADQRQRSAIGVGQRSS
jgi:hypothetical protein